MTEELKYDKMHIISVDYEPSSKRGGQELSLCDILIQLKLNGHSITLIYVNYGDLIEKYNRNGIETVQVPGIYIFNKLSVLVKTLRIGRIT